MRGATAIFFLNETKKDGKVDSIVQGEDGQNVGQARRGPQADDGEECPEVVHVVGSCASVVAEGECDAECVARDGCLQAFDRLDWLLFQFVFVVEGQLRQILVLKKIYRRRQVM